MTVFEAPSDAQLALITRLCHERGIWRLVIVYSKQDASGIIDALKADAFDPAEHAGPWRFIGGIRDELPEQARA